MKNRKLLWISILVAWMTLPGCDYNRFDEPLAEETETLAPTTTIRDLKGSYITGGTVIRNEVIVVGKVISSDREGNIYKSLFIQDATGGIEVKVASSGLYNFYREGDMVALKCKGLKLGAYAENISIGAVSVDSKYENDYIPFPVMENYIVKGKKEAPVEPLTLTIPELQKKYSNMLIALHDVQFLESELALNYADAEHKTTQNRTLVDRNNNRLVVRTSGYARFAGSKIAQGSGTIVGILSYFNTTAQLTIISLDDVKLNNPRF